MRSAATRAVRALRQRGVRQFLVDAVTETVDTWLAPRVAPWFQVRALEKRDLANICSSEGTFFEEYAPAESHVLKLPTLPDGYDPDDREHVERTYCSGMEIDAPYVCELGDVDLVGPTAVPVKDGGYVFEQFLSSPRRLSMGCLSAAAGGTLPHNASGGEPDLGTVVSLVGPWNYNYTHWFQDYLARMEGVEHFRSVTGVEPDVLVPADASEWMLDALRAVGVPEERWIGWRGGRARVDRLIHSSIRREERGYSPNRRILYSPNGVRWVRDRIRDNIEPERTVEHSRRIYISRSGALKRRVTNEEAVMGLLSEWGFRRYRPETLSFAEQVTLFSEAEAIVAPHGSGLMNQIFADDAVIVELLGKKQTIMTPATEYYYAELLGHDYGCVPGEPVGADVRADIAGLDAVLEKLLGE